MFGCLDNKNYRLRGVRKIFLNNYFQHKQQFQCYYMYMKQDLKAEKVSWHINCEMY